jgi:ABC-2 type transport system permease protein
VSDIRLALRQVVYTNRAFWRNPASAFFTFFFPLFFLVIFTALFGNDPTELGSGTVRGASFYVPAMAAFGVVSACYTNIAISVTFQRDAGVLKRIAGTPLPGSVYLVGRVVHAMAVAFVLVVVCALFGTLVYDAGLPSAMGMLHLLLALLVGGASFAALGLACTTIVPNADAAPAIVNATVLPVLFLSDVFINTSRAPEWVQWIGRIFPVKHFAEALQSSFLPQVVPWRWTNVGIVAVWGLAGLLVAIRRFRWEPSR